MGSVVLAHGLSCPKAWGIVPESPALEGRFLTTGPLGNSVGISNKLPGDTDAARVPRLRALKLEGILEVLLLSLPVLNREETSNLVALNHAPLLAA